MSIVIAEINVYYQRDDNETGLRLPGSGRLYFEMAAHFYHWLFYAVSLLLYFYLDIMLSKQFPMLKVTKKMIGQILTC